MTKAQVSDTVCPGCKGTLYREVVSGTDPLGDPYTFLGDYSCSGGCNLTMGVSGDPILMP